MSEINNIVVFGCETPVGQQILRRGLVEGLEVTAFTYDTDSIPKDITEKENITIKPGDVLDIDQVEDAIEGHDAVLSALEPRGKGLGESTDIFEAYHNIIAGMKTHNIARLAIVSNAICLPRKKRLFDGIKRKWSGQSDHFKMIEILEQESASIDWIAMMAPEIIEGTNINPNYKVERNNMPGEWTVTTCELADFMVKVFMDRTSTECFRHNKLGISSHQKKPFKWIWWTLSATMIALFGVLLYKGGLPSTFQQFVDQVMFPARVPDPEQQPAPKVGPSTRHWAFDHVFLVPRVCVAGVPDPVPEPTPTEVDLSLPQRITSKLPWLFG